MTCKYCRALDLDRVLRGEIIEHHSTFEELNTCSSTGDCQLCAWIVPQFEKALGAKKLQQASFRTTKIYYYIPPRNLDDAKASENWSGISHLYFSVGVKNSTGDSSDIIIGLFVPEGSRLADSRVISGRPISKSASDDTCFELVKRWRDNCLAKHGASCLKAMKRKLPTRIIDVGPADGTREPSLKISGDETGEWVALSHCWGTESKFVTNTTNIQLMEHCIALEDMPRTFYDAVTITRRLGYQYLWIDSLCILQGDREDWIAESACMREYYKNASITISADCASGDHVGFLDHFRELPECVKITLASNEEIWARKWHWIKQIDGENYVKKRAWTLQEYVLASRSLRYTPEQLVWECHTRKYCESNHASQGDDFLDIIHDTKRFFYTPALGTGQYPRILPHDYFNPSYRWYSLVNDYLNRDITFRKDLLPAISGLAREIQAQTGKTYAAGVWVEDICEGLLWTRNGTGKTSTAYYAPSWSWASLENLPRALDSRRSCYATPISQGERKEWRACLISHHIVSEGDDPFGCVISGSIRIRGRFLAARDWRGKVKPYFISSGRYRTWAFADRNRRPDQLICSFDVAEEGMIQERLFEQTMMFQITAWDWDACYFTVASALLLVRVKDQPVNTYRRVGIVEVPNIEGLAEKGWEMKEITII